MDHTIVKVKKEEFDGEMPSYFPPRHVVVKEEPPEMCPAEKAMVEPIPSQSAPHVESTQVQPCSDSRATEIEDGEEFWPFSGKPLFHLILAKTHVKPPYNLGIPVKIVKGLPLTEVPVVLRYYAKNWNMVYQGGNKVKRFDSAGWKTFVLDNNLKVGYGCFFELSECSQRRIKFRVQVIRTDGIPYMDDDEVGDIPERPIIID